MVSSSVCRRQRKVKRKREKGEGGGNRLNKDACLVAFRVCERGREKEKEKGGKASVRLCLRLHFVFTRATLVSLLESASLLSANEGDSLKDTATARKVKLKRRGERERTDSSSSSSSGSPARSFHLVRGGGSIIGLLRRTLELLSAVGEGTTVSKGAGAVLLPVEAQLRLLFASVDPHTTAPTARIAAATTAATIGVRKRHLISIAGEVPVSTLVVVINVVGPSLRGVGHLPTGRKEPCLSTQVALLHDIRMQVWKSRILKRWRNRMPSTRAKKREKKNRKEGKRRMKEYSMDSTTMSISTMTVVFPHRKRTASVPFPSLLLPSKSQSPLRVCIRSVCLFQMMGTRKTATQAPSTTEQKKV